MEGVADASVLIVLLPGGKGTHVELGMALAARRKVYLYSPDDFLTFVMEKEKNSFPLGDFLQTGG